MIFWLIVLALASADALFLWCCLSVGGRADKISSARFERLCEAVHDGWQQERRRQGRADHPDMVPYSELSEQAKEYDRETVRRVLDGLGVPYGGSHEDHP